jgi:anti-sigma factor (TIGR02949 family)
MTHGSCGGGWGGGHGKGGGDAAHQKCCRDAIDLLMDYLERRLPEQEQSALDAHFSRCPPCLHFLKAYRETSRIVKQCTGHITVPSEVKDRLRQFLASKKREK